MIRSLVISLALVVPTFSAANEAPMECSIGPVERTFGGTEWIVYGCSDGKSVVALTAKGNPGGPFYFMMFPADDEYRLYGEGTGNKDATQAAYDELSSLLSPEFVAGLHESASGVSASSQDVDKPN